jgi:hypothetical protein
MRLYSDLAFGGMFPVKQAFNSIYLFDMEGANMHPI